MRQSHLNLSTTFPMILTLSMITTSCQSPAPNVDPAELVIRGGKIVTMDPARPQVEALAARGGKIVALGTSSEITPHVGPQTEVIELGGQLAVPGLIEAHAHFVGIGDSRLQLDLRSATSWDEIVAQVQTAAAQAAPGEWIRGRGWHQEKWRSLPEPNVEGFPLHAALSAISPENPVLLTHASGHAIFVNAKALEIAGVDSTTPDPPGGDLLRDASGAPTGLLRETAEELVFKAFAPDGRQPAETVRKAITLASEECLRKGITSFQDAGSSFATVDLLRETAESGKLGVRLWVMLLGAQPDLAEKLDAYRLRGVGNDHLSVGGIKLWIDGALGSRGAWLLEPYSDSPSSTGLNQFPMEEARRVSELAVAHGYQMAIHAIGDRGNREVLDLYESVAGAHPDKRDLRWRIEHAQHLHPDDVPRFAKLGVIPSIQAVHCTSDGPWVPERLGEERSRSGAYVWRSLLASGARIANGTDAPVEDVDPIANFHAAVTRRMADGTQFYPEQAMTREEALRAATLDAAYAVFEEDLKGSLEVGKLADVTVLSQDLLTVPEAEILKTRVVTTIVGGKVAYRAP